MKTIREALHTIKKIRGFKTDADLAEDMDISLNTMRSWIRNESITKQIIAYCAKHNISIDETLLDIRIFNKDRCELCAARLQCDEYRRATSNSLVVNEDMFSPKTILINTHLTESISWKMFQQNILKSECAFDLELIDRILIELHQTTLD